MKKCQGLLNNLLYTKKKAIHQNRSLDCNTNNKISTIVAYNSKLSKSKPKISLNKTQNIKLTNDSVIENKKLLPPPSYSNHIKIKSQNHSFTTAIPSEKLFLNVSNHKNNQTYLNPQTTSNVNCQNSDCKPIPISQIQFNNGYSNITYYNKMKQKMSSNIMHDKSSSNVSFYQYHKGLLSNLKLQKEKKISQYLNKSMSSYEEEWCDKDKDTLPNANTSSLSLHNRLKVIEGQLEDGLNELNKQNEGKLILNAKSYNIYKIALEEVLKELPHDYYQIIKKIVNGYHQIIITFVSEQKKIIENYDDLQTKYTSISKELIAIKSSNNIDVNESNIIKTQSQFDNKNTQPKLSKEDNNNSHINTHIKTPGNTYLFSLLNTKHDNKKLESYQNEKEGKGYINNTYGDKKKSSQMTKMDIEDLEALYFSDKVINGINSSIGMNLNVPKLSLNFLG